MHLSWSETWKDIIEEANQILVLCERFLIVLPPYENHKSAEVLQRVHHQLANDEATIRRGPHFWGTQLANVSIRILRKLPLRKVEDRDIARQLANFCGIVFNFRRKSSTDGDYENAFRDSLECYLQAVLPDLVPTVIAADILDDIGIWLKQFYERTPKDLRFKVNDIILNAYESERRRQDVEQTHGLMVRFVEDNRDLISLPVSEASEYVRKRWENLYRDQIGEPPSPPETVITAEVRSRLKEAVAGNDPMAVRDVLAPLEPALIKALRKSLDVTFDLREPTRTVRDYSRQPTADFQAARRQLKSNNKQALTGFLEIWRKQPQNLFAKEWYAYALARFEGSWRQAKVMFEQIRDADKGDEITDWNLACCEIKLGDQRAAFEILQSRVESGTDFDDVLAPAIALALDLKEKRFLARQLDWLPLDEAILLSYVSAADSDSSRDDLEQRLPAIEVIAAEAKPFQPPDPAEAMKPQDLEDLAFAFMRRGGTLRGGITWFRRRVSFQEYRFFYLSWKLLGDLYIQARQFDQAEYAYDTMLQATSRSRTTPEVKQQTLESVLNIMLEQEQTTAAARLVDKFKSFLPTAELARWQMRTRSEEADRTGEIPQTHEGLRPAEDRVKQMEAPGKRAEDPKQQAEARFLQVLPRVSAIRRIEDLKGDFSLLTESVSCLYDLWPAYSRTLADKLRAVVDSLSGFSSSSDSAEREQFAVAVRSNMAEANAVAQQVSPPELKVQAGTLLTVLGRLAAEASFQTSTTHTIELDWHLTEYLPDKTTEPSSPELPSTALLLRITNTGSDQVIDAAVSLKNETGNVGILQPVQRLEQPLKPGASAVVRFPLQYESLVGQEAFIGYVRFSAGGVTDLQTPAVRFSLAAESFAKRLGGAEMLSDHFFVGLGIPEDRRDVFHGRGKEQERIAQSVGENVQPEVLFLNGPRRVGKTSILNSLQWALPEHGRNEIITVSVPEEIPKSTGTYLWGIASEISKSVDRHLKVENYLHLPPVEEFAGEPTVAFRTFCDTAQQRLSPRRVLLMIDETQRLAEAVKVDRIDTSVLDMFSTLMGRNSGVMFVFTASVLFRNVKDLSPHPIWGRVTQYATGFLSSDAVVQVLRAGVAGYPVKFTPEALARIWQMTEGHPWVVQAIGKRLVSEVLNPQRRLTVAPADVDQVVNFIERNEDQFSYYWWNEKKEEGGFIDESDWEIAHIILDRQKGHGIGISKTVLFEEMARRGKPIDNQRLRKLMDMQTLVKEAHEGVETVRIKGLFLERWLSDQLSAKRHATVSKSSEEVALFVDHENVSISLKRFVEQLTGARKSSWIPLSDPAILARRLAQHAERFGPVISRVAVANWPLFTQDLPAYAHAMFSFDQPLGGKNTSDDKLKQLIRDTLEKEPRVGTFVLATGDADFRDTIQTLLKRNKRVILWGFHAVGAIKSNISSAFREMETWQNVTIEYLDDLLLKEPSQPAGSHVA
jgi:hypothetical protein